MKTLIKYLKIFINLFITVLTCFIIIFVVPKFLVFFLPFVIGWLISIIANPLVRFLESKVKILRKHSSVLIIIVVLALIIGGGYFGIARLAGEIGRFASDIPDLYKKMESDFIEAGDNLQGIYQRLPNNLQKAIDQFGDNLSTYAAELVRGLSKPTFTAAGNFARNLPSILVSVIVTIVSAYFFIADRERIYGFAYKHTPAAIRDKVLFIYKKFKEVISGYFKAQFKIMVVVAAILFVGFLILRIEFAILLAILIAFLDFLPVFGTGTVLIPWALFDILSADYKSAVGLLVLYAVTQLVRQVIQPKIVGDTIGMHPFLTLVFIYLGYKWGSVLGMIIAIPVGMIIITLYETGAFDSIILYLKIIVDDINKFRKLDLKEPSEEEE